MSPPERAARGHVAYKILTADQLSDWQREGVLRGTPADLADGFIHLSLASQVPGTLDKHYRGQQGLVLVAVDLAGLGGTLRWEQARGGELFPHVHGELTLDAIVATGPVERTADGGVRLPNQAARARA
jgi:uncharacterized protein (DUF952 family)